MSRCSSCRARIVLGMPGHGVHERIGGGIVCSAACANVGFGINELRTAVVVDRGRPSAERMAQLMASPRFELPGARDAIGWQELYHLLDTFYPRDYAVWAALHRRAGVPDDVRDLLAGRAGKYLEIYPMRDIDARLQ